MRVQADDATASIQVNSFRFKSFFALPALLLASCTLLPPELATERAVDAPLAEALAATQAKPAPEAPAVGQGPVQTRSALPKVELYKGSGQVIDRTKAADKLPPPPAEGTVTLNFEGADLREVIKFVLGDMLGENYLIDPRVQGQVTLQTSHPLAVAALVPTLETVLRMNGAALVREQGMYRIVPLAEALRSAPGPGLSQRAMLGYEVRIFPLRFVAAQEMQTILQPFIPEGGLVRTDPLRNLLIIGGTSAELDKLQETVEIFDVDFLQGMSVGLFRLDNVEVGTLTGELERLFGESSGGPLAGLFRLIPIDRLNAILVVTPQPAYLEKAKVWIERLDRVQNPDSPRLFVYRMQHVRAEDVAGVLSDVFGGGSKKTTNTSATAGAPSLAPGLEPVEIGVGEGGQSPQSAATPAGTVATGGSSGAVGEVKIIADATNNALLVLATQRDYDTIEAAIQQLDISPLQVLVDATIVEVSLSGELSYGLQWFFKNGLDNKEGRGIFANAATLATTFPGFNYSVVDSANEVRVVLNALAEDSKVNVISSPSIMVLDNQSATIKVGDQVPIRTSESVNLSSDDPVTTTNIQYRDTGVSLTVTPRVNAGGMVIMDIDQEVNDVSSTTTSGIDSPTIQQRRIESSVAVQSGESIVLGGLIREIRSGDESGIPVLHRVPVIGPLFGSTSRSARRTELIVLITPRVASNQLQARQITEEFRSKLTRLPEPRRK